MERTRLCARVNIAFYSKRQKRIIGRPAVAAATAAATICFSLRQFKIASHRSAPSRPYTRRTWPTLYRPKNSNNHFHFLFMKMFFLGGFEFIYLWRHQVAAIAHCLVELYRNNDHNVAQCLFFLSFHAPARLSKSWKLDHTRPPLLRLSTRTNIHRTRSASAAAAAYMIKVLFGGGRLSH
jgi:hypothetical protein